MTESTTEQNDIGEADVQGLTKKILEICKPYDLETVLTVLVNLIGHIVASLCDNNLGNIKKQVGSMAMNIRKCAVAKCIYEADRKRRNGTKEDRST